MLVPDPRTTPGVTPPPDRVLERDACGIGFVADAGGRPQRRIVELALQGLGRLRHRGALSADAQTGDGAGLLVPIPRAFVGGAFGVTDQDASRAGIISLFIVDRRGEGEICASVERACEQERLRIVGWRRVPVDAAALGEHARATRPRMLQAALLAPAPEERPRSEQRAHRLRRRVEAAAPAADRDVYVASSSFTTVTYKALAAADLLAAFYPDLQEPSFAAPFAIFHQRYSTNTAPTWERAQPFRVLCHNGEINTIAGNTNRMRARAGRLGFADAATEALFRPAFDEAGSDSAILDETAELLVKEGGGRGTGRDIRHAVAMLVPAAWEESPDLDERRRGFYRWHASLMEPWDGPAALIFTDGVAVGAALDRNGLRPLRFRTWDDGLVACASEAGVLDVADATPVVRGRVGPGRLLVVDPRTGGLDDDAVDRIARARPWATWARTYRRVDPPEAPAVQDMPAEEAVRRQVAHGYTREDVTLLLRSAAAHGHEPTFSMGDDAPLAVLTEHERSFFNHLRQRFAQVTNPAMDHLRERSMMSLGVLLGPQAPVLIDGPEGGIAHELQSFFLWTPIPGRRLDAAWRTRAGPHGLRERLQRLVGEAVEAVADGVPTLVITHARVGSDRAPIPSALAVGAVNAGLTRAGLRSRCSLLADVDDVKEAHDVACLLALGAQAVRPRLAAVTLASLVRDGEEPTAALQRYRDAVEDGVRKTLAKLGISCLESYRGAEAVDVLGLDDEVVEVSFVSTRSVLAGLGFEDIASAILARHASAYGGADPRIAHPGYVKHRRGGEHHANEPTVVRAAHRVADPALKRLRTTAAGVKDDFERTRTEDALHADRRVLQERLSAVVHGRPATALRDLLEIRPGAPVPLAEVEPARAILARFSTGAISHGSISAEAHETLALGMNAIGARSNTGEGGEDPARFRTAKNSKIKQVASARFGVTPAYCAYAEELQIKIAQGSKPGEGGQLPGSKVTVEIARLRHTRPGVALLSPAPHHDIYSIEDLAQLVFDLRAVNPAAAVSVKLVAEEGIGAVAAGVAKALADVVHISGADGGTGASPLSSIKNAGLPWELGLVEAQHALADAGLRSRVRLRVDGGLKTGRDVLMAALLGADEYSFGTAALLAEGCLMVRSCHLDTCPAGIATQRSELRARFAGTPEMLAAFMTEIAEEVRRLMADLGVCSLDEVIGRTDLLGARHVEGRAALIDPSPLFRRGHGERRHRGADAVAPPTSLLGDRIFRAAWPAIRDGRAIELAGPIRNTDRAIGARLGGAIGKVFLGAPPAGSARVRVRGEAGQSFGAFLADGVELSLTGEANDYVGKGMGGGRIVITPPPGEAPDPCLAGNTVLYGATGGSLFVAGRVGERFAVRNSGAVAVIEGAGDHACEYMTGGTVVVLGNVGRNLAAGMTGGELFVFDPADVVASRLNPELATAIEPDAPALDRLRHLVERHHELTGSLRAGLLLHRWARHRGQIVHVVPRADIADVPWPSGAEGPRTEARAAAGAGLSLSPGAVERPTY